MDKEALFKVDLGTKLVEIQDICIEWGLPITKLTLIVRDPSNDKMFYVLTNESKSGLEHAVSLVMFEDSKSTK